ncbi:hypothetical protein [Streptomyces sp. H27-H5]|uniref:hypothetical protein n=1 Tax=Streptomyces sp. H27-H5 TaxID=2996460 RepID=UPI00226D8526|nr:hypothetical protein [Streptomyces sp. H27-H5]MCY0959940.1 hypothetical protein [Streptomyces sp. H27-H5]
MRLDSLLGLQNCGERLEPETARPLPSSSLHQRLHRQQLPANLPVAPCVRSGSPGRRPAHRECGGNASPKPSSFGRRQLASFGAIGENEELLSGRRPIRARHRPGGRGHD